MVAHANEFIDRVLEAVKDIKSSPYSKVPPLYRLAWRLGLMIPPPPLAGFWCNVFFLGLAFTIGWGGVMALLHALSAATWPAVGGIALLIGALVAGLLFGLMMALYWSVKRRGHDLPRWQSLIDAG